MRKSAPKTDRPSDNRAPPWQFWLWVAATLLFVQIVIVLGTAWAVRHAIGDGPLLTNTQKRIMVTLAEFPMLVRNAVREVQSRFNNDPLPLLIDRKTIEKPYWVRRFPAPEDTGYLLFSGVDPVAKHSIVKLIRISDGVNIARWDPDWGAIFKQSTAKKYGTVGSSKTKQILHPLLMPDGDIIFNWHGPSLVRLSPCSRNPVWVLDEVTHHSNELDISGSSLWVPSVSQDGFTDNVWLRDHIRDDALARVSTDGRLIEKRSFVRILRNNNLQGLLLGTSGERLNEDLIHINQIAIAPQDSRYWQHGDLLISARNLSTVFLYRPSNGKILWLQTGPWINQHSADFVNDHQISVFDNNALLYTPKGHEFVAPSDINRVILYDFDTGQTSEPFAALLAVARPVSPWAGRARVLPDGGLFLEETAIGRHLRFTRDHLLWSRVNDYDDKRIGILSWSRYLTAEEARIPLQALASGHCPAVPATVK